MLTKIQQNQICGLRSTPTPRPIQNSHMPRLRMKPLSTLLHHLLEVNPRSSLCLAFFQRTRLMTSQILLSSQTIVGLYDGQVQVLRGELESQGAVQRERPLQMQTSRKRWKEFMEEQPLAWAGRIGWIFSACFSSFCFLLALLQYSEMFTRSLRVNWVRSLIICRLNITSKYQNSMLEISRVRITPYSRPVMNSGSCRNIAAEWLIIQYEQLSISLMKNMRSGNIQKKAIFISRLLQIAGRMMSPQMMMKTRTRMKTCFDLCFSLKDITEQQQITMHGQVKKLRLRTQLAMMMGIARRRITLEDFQGSMDIMKAMVSMIQQQGKLASWMRQRMEKVTQYATKSQMKQDLKLNLQGIFLIMSQISFSSDFIYTLSSLTWEFVMFIVFSLLALSQSFWKDLTDDLLRWRVRTDYLRRLVFMIYSIT